MERLDRLTFHARRKLPDKEFRYLRTVRVTAIVDQLYGTGQATVCIVYIDLCLY